MTKSELKEMIRECLHEELSKTILKESADSSFYVTYEDTYYEGIDLCYVARSDAASRAHWETDIDDFQEAGQSEEFGLFRAFIDVDEADVEVFERIANKEFTIGQRSDWIAACDLLSTYIDAGKVKVIDEEGTIK